MLKIDAAKCSGCRRCETHCSFFHSGRTGRLAARIKVEKIEGMGTDIPVVCVQCKERYCTRCPEHAITVTERGSIEVSPTLCTLCGACEQLCPVGAIQIYNAVPHVCDLCGGDPRCVAACEMGAIEYLPDVMETVSLAEFKKKTKKKTPSEKRYTLALEKSLELRETWKSRGEAL